MKSPVSEDKELTGEPDAEDPHARFGGRGGAIECAVPTYIRIPHGFKNIATTRPRAAVEFVIDFLDVKFTVLQNLHPWVLSDFLVEQAVEQQVQDFLSRR